MATQCVRGIRETIPATRHGRGRRSRERRHSKKLACGLRAEKGVVYVTMDPEHPSLRANAAQSLERMLAHELHHCARWDGPGYGEALVSEGLAGHFEQEVFGGEAELWESLPASTLRPCLSKAEGETGRKPDMVMPRGSLGRRSYQDGWVTC